MLGLSHYTGQLSVSCPCQKDMPNARPHPSTCTTSTIASCLRARNAGHWQHVILGNPSPVICFAFHVCRFAMVISTYFNIFQLISTFGPKVPLSASYCMNKDAPASTMGPRGYGSNLAPPKLGRIRCEFLKWWTFVGAWGFSVHHFGTLNYLSLATGWNLWCVASSH